MIYDYIKECIIEDYDTNKIIIFEEDFIKLNYQQLIIVDNTIPIVKFKVDNMANVMINISFYSFKIFDSKINLKEVIYSYDICLINNYNPVRKKTIDTFYRFFNNKFITSDILTYKYLLPENYNFIHYTHIFRDGKLEQRYFIDLTKESVIENIKNRLTMFNIKFTVPKYNLFLNYVCDDDNN